MHDNENGLVDNEDEETEYGYEDYNNEEDNAWRTITDEAKRQHNLSVGIINSMMMRIGIILAFTPLILIESVRHVPDDAVFSDYLSIVCLAACFGIGIYILLKWKLSMPDCDMDVDKLMELYVKERWDEIQNHVLTGAINDHNDIESNVYELKRLVFAMVMFLLSGILLFVCMILNVW